MASTNIPTLIYDHNHIRLSFFVNHIRIKWQWSRQWWKQVSSTSVSEHSGRRFNCLRLGKLLFKLSLKLMVFISVRRSFLCMAIWSKVFAAVQWPCLMLALSTVNAVFFVAVWRPCFMQASSTVNVVFLVAVWWPCFVQVLSTVNVVLSVAVW